ncbi:membrane-targeted effector domain-containing toxin [Pseudomonas sp. B21-048]|uniref:membrane-targeted effector domain-containing toxin n=1 Tax=Pseudomonas sp. B21-048 TaxID=2895490 RepID=UPI00215F7954|nr:membrane-targeted effector domain-containing toxin [Pseudomonas sp. B21-048]UVK97790.1 membrane-targeted effector domain-containing toxin [Pseudomonas sp. B21-048]
MNPTETRPLPNAADKAALKAIATTVIQTCPSLQDTAHEVASDLLKKYGIAGLDPDQVYFHRFDASQSSSKAFTGWEHVDATPTSSMTLTQLVIHRFRTADQDNADLLDVYAGFYSAGPNAGTFNETNEVRLHGNEVLKEFWSIDFSAKYRDRLTTYWNASAADFRTLAKCNFLIAAVKARDKRQLSDDDFQFVTNAVIGPITWPVNLQLLQAQHPCADNVRALDVDGYVATNILRFVAPKGRQIVYLPGETVAFKVLETATDMHYWILLQMNKDAARQAFMTHFSLADRQTIAENITDLMNRLVSTWGKYDHHLINKTNRIISSDAFSWLRDSTKAAMFAEADLSLTSNGDLRKKLWIGYLSAGVKVFGPMAVVGWPIALPLVGASIANLGLNIDQAVNAKTAEERKAGVLGAVFASIDVLFNLLVLKGPGSMEEIGPEIDAAEASEMAEYREGLTPDESRESVSEPAEPAEPSEPATGSPDTTGTSASPSSVPDAYKIDVLLDDETLVREPGKFQGIHRLPSNPSSAIKLKGNAYYARYENNLNGRSHWAIVDPANPDSFSGSIPVRFLTAAEEWEVVPKLGLRGGMDIPPIATAGPSVEPVVEGWARTPGVHVPGLEDPEMRAWALGGADVRALFRRVWTIGSIDMRSVLMSDVDTVGARSVLMSPLDELTESLSEFDLAQEEPRSNLVSDAKAYYELNPPNPRLPISTVQPIETSTDLLDAALTEKPGLVVGESRGSIGSKQFLIENMPALAQRAVKTLYLQELLANVNQLELDTFARTGEMPEELESYLKKLDIKAGNDPDGKFNLLTLVKAANAQRIRVQALDMSTTYNINKEGFAWESDYQMARSFFASEVIQFNEELKELAKWVALVNQENMATFRGYRGISEQTDALSIRIDDVAAGQAQSIASDPGLAVEYADFPDSPVYDVSDGTEFDNIHDLIKGDWRVQMETPWAYRTPRELKALLPEPGMFTFQRYTSSILVVYRNAEGRMADSVIRMTPGGRLNLDTPLRPAYESMTVDNLDELKEALIAKGMKPMGWPEVAGEADGAASLIEDLPQAQPEIQRPDIPDNWQANELLEGKTPGTDSGKFQGIYQLDSNPSTAIMLDDTAYYVRYEADANGGGTWAIIDPEHPKAFSGSIPVRLNAQGDWELAPRAGLKGGGNTQPGPSRVPVQIPPQVPAQIPPQVTLRSPSTQYDAPGGFRLRKLALGIRENHIKVMRQPNGSLRGISTYDEYIAAPRVKLSRDARQFFSRSNFTPSLPPRPAIPAVTPSTTAAELIQKVFEATPGMVIGESQDRIASMRFLIENMPTLARQGVRTLYFQRLLNDFSQLDLNQFFSSGELSDDLEMSLQKLKSDPSGQFTPLEVVKAARLNGIRIQATDCLASYRYPASPLPDMHEQAIKTYLTHTIMQADQSLNGAGKWVVLTDQENTNTFRGMAGISEMQGGIGLRIEEVLPEEKLLIETDQGIDVGRGFASQPEGTNGDSDTLLADLSLKTPLPLLERTQEELERLLFRQGMFTFEKSNGSWTLIHRARDTRIIRTLVERTVDGKYLINRPSWTEVHQVPYANIVELSWALSRMGMNLEGRLPL